VCPPNSAIARHLVVGVHVVAVVGGVGRSRNPSPTAGQRTHGPQILLQILLRGPCGGLGPGSAHSRLPVITQRGLTFMGLSSLIKPTELPMTPPAWPCSSWPPEEGMSARPALWPALTRTQEWLQFQAYSPVFPQAPTEPRPAAWVDAARSNTHSVGQTPQVKRARRYQRARHDPCLRHVCCDACRSRVTPGGADTSPCAHCGPSSMAPTLAAPYQPELAGLS
jgi:hypothetical protein